MATPSSPLVPPVMEIPFWFPRGSEGQEGGSPSVWSVAMVFFQTLLLAGYAYAHLLTRFLSSRTAVIVQIAVMAIAVIALPLSIASGWGRPPEAGEAFWLIGLFAASIGLPFFALSANASDPQQWVWTDDYSNVAGAVLRHLRPR